MLLDSNEVNLGWKLPELASDDANGCRHSLSEHLTQRGLLVAFICNHCPYVHAIVNRMVVDFKSLQKDGVGVITIMSNDYLNYPADSPDNMLVFAEQHDFSFPYLVDEDQSIAKQFGAVCTPDFFGFNVLGELQYRGRLDDAKMGDSGGRSTELLDAMSQIADHGRSSIKQFPSMGCSIKWKT